MEKRRAGTQTVNWLFKHSMKMAGQLEPGGSGINTATG